MNIEQTVSQAFEGLGLGNRFSYDELLTTLEHQRGRKIHLKELSTLTEHGGLCALLLAAEHGDLILLIHTDSELHRQQFVLHEFAHLILGHCDDESRELNREELDALLPDIPTDVRVRFFARTDIDSTDEISAEHLADRLAAAIRNSAFKDSSYGEVFG